jgi:nicotinate dehydrogenase subunit B
MKSQFDFEPGFEPERYELDAGPAYRFNLRRRNFFKTVTTGIVVALLVKPALAQETGGGRRRGSGNRPQDIGAWLHIAEDATVTVYTGKVEVGQNIRTSLAQVVAEELRVPITSVRMVMSDTKLVPYDAGTFGSRTTPDMARQLRRVAAAARELLIDLAAEELKTDRASLIAADGKITSKDAKLATDYGKLTKGQKLTKAAAENPPLTPPEQWKVAGKSAAKQEGRAIVTGKHKYASDVNLPGMLHGKVLRPPAFGAILVSVDTKPAEEMKDVVVVHDGNFVGVAAPTELAASRALKAIKAEWKTTDQVSGKDLFAHFKKTARGGEGGRGGAKNGSMEEGLASADAKLKQTYTIAYIAHAPLEPRAAVAQWEDGKLTVWTGTQRPFGVRGDLAGAFRISEENVHVIVPDTGSGYGGKHRVETATEAARLAKAANKPVKVVWTREEEFTWAYFRPAGVIEISSGARKDGTLTAFEFHNYNSGGAGIRPLYDVPNQVVEFHQCNSPLQQGSYRALASTANHFARETHVDELAHELRLDPLEFRLQNLKDPRLRAVLEAAAKSFGWGKKPAANRGFGIAVGSEKGGYIATCAEVSVDKETGRVRVVRAVSAFECGAILNPDHLKSQVEGSMVMGIGGALTEAIEFENGKILNPKFSKYRVPRCSDTPEIEVVLLDRQDLPSAGAGEAPIICIAPAIGNAIFNAVGVRLRSLPMAPGGVVSRV